MELYVSPTGNDAWSGLLPTPNKAKTDGPLASITAARDRIRTMKDLTAKRDGSWSTTAISEPITVWLRGGRYEVSEPIILGPQDSFPVTYAAYKREKPILDGGVRIHGWKTQKVNGRRAWVAELPEVAAGRWAFRQLFVDGRRAPRSRWPKQGLFTMESSPGMRVPAGWGNGGQTQFVAAEGQVRNFAHPGDVEVVYLHFWIEERSNLASVDATKRMVTMARPSCSSLVASWGTKLADYYYDNVLEELSEPGEWYLERATGKLYYLPLPGEDPEKTLVYAPRCMQLLALVGEPDNNRFVEFVRFRGVTFRHTDWRHPSDDGAVMAGGSNKDITPYSRRHLRGNKAAAPQAACDVPGVVLFEGARHCALEDCTIEHIGWYGVEIGDACRGLRVVGNTIRDMGAGGVKINGAAARDMSPIRVTGQHRITDNVITAGGRIFHSAVGVLAMNAFGLVISHNHIHDLFYTGVSVGWEWGYHENVSRDNRVEKNHIHNIGQGLLSDMGGIYTLGVQPGTVLRGNLIHDVRSAHYGGWCIYPDEGSSHILVEHNVCYDADRQAFHQHYGRENVVRNNIFAFGNEAVAIYSRAEPHKGFTFVRNILIAEGKPIIRSQHPPEVERARMWCDLNLVWDVCGEPHYEVKGQRLTLDEWRKLGHDPHSKVADPCCHDLGKRDFRLHPKSPAYAMGFEAIDLSDVGPRKPGNREGVCG